MKISPSRKGALQWSGSFLGRTWRAWRGWILFLCLVWVPLRSAVIDYNPVPSGSMNPTILEGDVVWVNKLAYGLRFPLTLHRIAQWADPQRGDVIVVLSPADGTRLVKRVIGVPGDTIELRNNRLILNGREVGYTLPERDFTRIIASELRGAAVFAEEELGEHPHAVMGLNGLAASPRNFAPLTVPADSYFVMGDSRDNSFDSRFFGFVDRQSVLGRVGGVLVSLDINDTYLPRFSRFFQPLE